MSVVSTDTTHDSDNFTTQKSTSSLGIPNKIDGQMQVVIQQQMMQSSYSIYNAGFHGFSEPRITHNQRMEKLQQQGRQAPVIKNEAFETYNNMNIEEPVHTKGKKSESINANNHQYDIDVHKV